MLTRLIVRGFKNLVDVDLHFGPFTCIAGPNGAGKSNLFDAISFLSHLADKSFADAARSIRGGEDLKSLFSDPQVGKMFFRAEMLIENLGVDEFGQGAEASATFIYYQLELALEQTSDSTGGYRLKIENEELSYIPRREATKNLHFNHNAKWLYSVVKSSTRRTTFIQTEQDNRRGKLVRLRSDRMQDEEKSRRGGGNATSFLASSLPRTVLSSTQNAEETRTAVLVRRELRSWRQLQLEPSSLRSVDDFESTPRIDASGKHIPAVLNRLSSTNEDSEVFTQLANSLISLVEDVRAVRVDRDEARRALRFMMKDRNDLELPASSLSDGTMRFVALSVIELDPEESGLICLEEPENGIHPQRVDAMLDLLLRIAVDATIPVGEDNPLKQVIISTHSPSVVKYLDRDDVLFAVSFTGEISTKKIRGVKFLGLPETWRADVAKASITDGQAVAYLKGLPFNPDREVGEDRSVGSKYKRQLTLDFEDFGERSEGAKG